MCTELSAVLETSQFYADRAELQRALQLARAVLACVLTQKPGPTGGVPGGVCAKLSDAAHAGTAAATARPMASPAAKSALISVPNGDSRCVGRAIVTTTRDNERSTHNLNPGPHGLLLELSMRGVRIGLVIAAHEEFPEFPTRTLPRNEGSTLPGSRVDLAPRWSAGTSLQPSSSKKLVSDDRGRPHTIAGHVGSCLHGRA
jgi:hypothetical protein